MQSTQQCMSAVTTAPQCLFYETFFGCMLWRTVTPCRITAMQMATGWLSRWMPPRLWTRRWKAPRFWARHRLHAFGIRNLIAQAVKTAGLDWGSGGKNRWPSPGSRATTCKATTILSWTGDSMGTTAACLRTACHHAVCSAMYVGGDNRVVVSFL